MLRAWAPQEQLDKKTSRTKMDAIQAKHYKAKLFDSIKVCCVMRLRRGCGIALGEPCLYNLHTVLVSQH